jgi:ferrous iron transport protein B
MSTMAVVRRETNSWKWPVIQFLYMTGVAYVAAFVAYRITLLYWN